MPNKIAILKMGSLYPALEARRGSFEDWILAGMGLPKEQAVIPWVYRGDTLPDYADLAGVVITGSLAMVSDRLAWSERAAEWLTGAVSRRIPTLGICYGHQLLAHALGGQADNNPRGWEIGTTPLVLHPAARNDPLLGGLEDGLPVHVFHRQSAVTLPPGAVLLAHSAGEAHLAFVVGGCAWGVQFHPEFDVDIMQAGLHHDPGSLTRQGLDPAALEATLQDSPVGPVILRRFAGLCQF